MLARNSLAKSQTQAQLIVDLCKEVELRDDIIGQLENEIEILEKEKEGAQAAVSDDFFVTHCGVKSYFSNSLTYF